MSNPKIHCTVIPDGAVYAEAESKFDGKVSVYLTPDPDGYGAEIDLANWPHEIRRLTSSAMAKLYVGVFDEGKNVWYQQSFDTTSFDNWGAKAEDRDKISGKANQLWRRIFRNYASAGGDYRFDKLLAIFEGKRTLSRKMVPGKVRLNPDKQRYVQANTLGETLDAIKSAVAGSRLLAVLLGEVRKRAAETGVEVQGEVKELLSEPIFASFLARPFMDPSLEFRLELAKGLTFPERRPDALGRLAAIEDGQKTPFKGVGSIDEATYRQVEEVLLDELKGFANPATPPTRAANLALLARADQGIKTSGIFNSVHSRSKGYLEVSSELKSALKTHLALQNIAHPLEWSRPGSSKSADATEKEDNEIRRKMAGIRSIPMLSKFLGFVVDVKLTNIPPEIIGRKNLRIVAGFYKSEAEFKDAAQTSEKLDQTALLCSVDVIAGGEKDFIFAAAMKKDETHNQNSILAIEDFESDLIIRKGVVEFNDSDFSIKTHDPTLLLQSFSQNSNAMTEAVSAGAMASTLNAKLPESQNRGLQLLYHDNNKRTRSYMARAKKQKARAEARQAQIYYVNDLLIGFRPDVNRTRLFGDNTAKWRSLTARSIVIEEVWDAFGISKNNTNWHPYEEFRERDYGVVRSLTKAVPTKEGDKAVSTSQALVTWMGDHLGVPTPQEDFTNGKVKSQENRNSPLQEDLGIIVHYNFHPKEIAPVLRYADLYEFGLRTVLANGSSVTLSDAKKRYGEGSAFNIGETVGGKGYAFKYEGDIHAPLLLVPHNDPFANPSAKNKLVNERDNRIVLRSGISDSRKKATRYFVPARVSFERAEQFGLLDGQTDRAIPRGAFREYKRDVRGGFPAIETTLTRRDEQPEKSGMVLQPGGYIDGETSPYFPDALGQYLKVRFERDQAIPDGFDKKSPPRAFWKDASTPLDAKPIVLEVRAGKERTGGGKYLVDDATDTASGRELPKLAIEIAPGETVKLWYWSVPDPEVEFQFCRQVERDTSDLIKTFDGKYVNDPLGLRELRSAVDEIKRSTDERRKNKSFKAGNYTKLLNVIKEKQEHPHLFNNGWGQIEIVHAVEKPLRRPEIALKEGKHDFGVIRICPENAWNVTRILKSEVGGNTPYLVGAVSLDRKTTKELHIEAAWEDASDEAAISYDKEKKIWSYNPVPRITRLCEVKNVSVEKGKNKPDILDLTEAEDGSLRGVVVNAADFKNTFARELSLRLTAVSRFDKEFETTGDPSQFEVSNRKPFVIDKAGKDFVKDKVQASNEKTIWMRATAAPQTPVIDRVVWISPSSSVRSKNERTIERWCFPRIFFKRPLRLSGQELIAVICAPKDLVDDKTYPEPTPLTKPWKLSKSEEERAAHLRLRTLADFAKGGELHSLAEYVTRWGADPTTESGKLQPYIEPERFRGFIAKKQELKFRKLAAESDSGAAGRLGKSAATVPTEKVSAFIYQPKFDRRSGLWYVDIGFDPGAAYMPFVQFSIAAYQPYCEDGLELSAPVVLDPLQVPAKRTAKIKSKGNGVYTATVKGIGYLRRNPFVYGTDGMPPRANWAHKTDHTVQNMELLRKDSGLIGPIATYNARGQINAASRIIPESHGAELTWQWEFELSDAEAHCREYFVRFSEFELHIPDEDLRKTKDSDDKNFFVERPFMFSATIKVPTSPPRHNDD